MPDSRLRRGRPAGQFRDGPLATKLRLPALLVALLTVSYQALKAAFTDPVESLRYV